MIAIHFISFVLFIYIMITLCSANITRQQHKFKAKQLMTSIIDLIPDGPNHRLLTQKVETFIRIQQETGNFSFFDQSFQLREARNEYWERMQFDMYRDLVEQIPLFQGLDEEFLVEIVQASEEFVLPRETVLAYAGSIVEECYAIISGYCMVLPSLAHPEIDDRVLTHGDCIFIVEMLTELQILNAVVALTDVYVMRLTCDQVRTVFAKRPVENAKINDCINW